MKIDIYTLLGMIKDGKAPYKIQYLDKYYTYVKEDYEDEEGNQLLSWLFQDYCVDYVLNLKVSIPIVESKKIEKIDQTLNRIDMNNDYYRYIMENRFKINEIIEVLNENNRLETYKRF